MSEPPDSSSSMPAKGKGKQADSSSSMPAKVKGKEADNLSSDDDGSASGQDTDDSDLSLSQQGDEIGEPSSTANGKQTRNTFSLLKPDGVTRMMTICQAMLETTVVHEGKEKGVFDYRALKHVSTKVKNKILEKKLLCSDKKTPLFRGLSSTMVQRQWRLALEKANEIAKTHTPNGSTWQVCDARMAGVLQQMLENQRGALQNKAQHEEETKQSLEFRKQRRQLAEQRVNDRPPGFKKSARSGFKKSVRKRAKDFTDDEADDTDNDREGLEPRSPGSRSTKAPRHVVSDMGASISKMLESLAAQIEEKPQTQSNPTGIREKLTELQVMRNENFITEEEYTTARQSVLGNL